MTDRTNANQHSRRRDLVLLVVGALVLSLLPLAGLAQPNQVEDPTDACPDTVNPPAPFTDRLQIPEVHRLNVDCAFNNDIGLGFSDQTYRPRLIVQRDQFASFMVRTLRAAGVTLPAATDQGFTDISGNVHEDNINIIAQTGIAKGTSSTQYSPNQRLRRDQIGSFVLRAAAFIEDVPLSRLQRDTGPFIDVPLSNVHARNINGARALNLTVGRTAGTYEPSTGTRRDQMASFLIRLLAALNGGPLIPPEDRAETLVLTPESATNPVGTNHSVTATVRDADAALLADANVHFQVYRDPDGDNTFSGPTHTTAARTNAQGQVTFTYAGPANPAEDWIVACAARPEEPCRVIDAQSGTSGTQFTGTPQVESRVHDTARKNWRVGPTVTFTQAVAVNPPGTPHTATVTVRDGENQPDAGVTVRFEVYRGPTESGTFSGPVAAGNQVTNAQGQASFTYTGPNQEAVDRIVACIPQGGTCQVTDEDAGTAGTQFTGTPTVGARPHAVGTKLWRVQSAATALAASAFGLNVTLAGSDLVAPQPLVAITIPPTPETKEETDELLDVPASPLTEIGALRVAARGDRPAGFAQGDAEATDVELVFSDGAPLITADGLRAVSTSTCPTAGDATTASAGSAFVNLTIGDTVVPLTPAPNTNVGIPGVADVWVREVIPDSAGLDHGFTVRALRVTLLSGPNAGAEIIVGEAHSSIACS